MKKKFLTIFVLISLLIGSVLIYKFTLNNVIGKSEGNVQILKDLMPKSIKDWLKKTIFKKEYLSKQEKFDQQIIKKIHDDNVSIYEKKINLIETLEIQSSKNQFYQLKKFSLPHLDTYSMGMKPPAYLSIFQNHLIIVTGKADFFYISLDELKKENVNFNFIKTNFDELIDKKKYILPGLSAPRDIEIIDDNLYISYHDKNSCDKLSIAQAKINVNYLNFKNFFTWNACVDKNFGFKTTDTLLDQQSGGRIRDFDKENIIFTIGSFDEYSEEKSLSQDMNSLFGSIISINKKNKSYKILSKGHRNQQGLYFDEVNKFILSTEHGPDGGDELNIINPRLKNIQNFGWPISSYGEHYPSKHHDWENINRIDLMEKLAPLKKSHSDYGFIEPIKFWTPSIAISEVIKVPAKFNPSFENDFFISSMGNVVAEGDHSIHHLRFNKEFKKIIFEDKIIIKERIRDIIYSKRDNSVILVLGNTPSLAVLTYKPN